MRESEVYRYSVEGFGPKRKKRNRYSHGRLNYLVMKRGKGRSFEKSQGPASPATFWRRLVFLMWKGQYRLEVTMKCFSARGVKTVRKVQDKKNFGGRRKDQARYRPISAEDKKGVENWNKRAKTNWLQLMNSRFIL